MLKYPMLESFSQIDTPVEFAESAVAVIAVFVGLMAGNWLGKMLYQFLGVISGIGLLAIPVWGVANGTLTEWKDIGLVSVGLGLIVGTVLFPLSSISRVYQRVEDLETKLKIYESVGD